MADVVTPLRVYCFALDREAKPFLRKRVQVRVGWCSPPSEFRVCATPCGALVLFTGIGATATRFALEWAARGYCLGAVTVAGFCGALTPASQVGDVLHFREVIDESGTVYPCGDSGIRLLTTSRMIADPLEKKQLAEKYGADAVDMESATAVKWCIERNIPVRVVRAVSDDAETRLSPRLVNMLSRGEPSLIKVLGELLRSPKLLPELLRLARHTRLAAEKLAFAL